MLQILAALATSVIIISIAAAAAMAAVGYRRNQALQFWALSMFVHGCAYSLYLLRGQVHDLVAIVFPNVGIALTLALLGEGFGKFYRVQIPRFLVWAAVPLVAILFTYFLDNLTARLLISGTLFTLQSLVVINLVLRQRQRNEGRGQVIVIVSLALLAGLLVMRTVVTLAGLAGMIANDVNMMLQAITLLSAIASLVLMAIGLPLLVAERTERELAEHRDHLEELVALRTRELVDAKEAAEAASRAKSVFLMNMSHELRTPLNGIMGMTEIASRRVMDPKVLDYLDKAMQSARRLLKLITDLLEVARLGDAQLILDSVHFTLSTVVERTSEHLGALVGEKGLQISVECPETLANLQLQGDPERLVNILEKLTENAVKFTERGDVGFSVQLIEETPHQAVLRFVVRDSGIGIAADDQQRIFDLFEQGDGSETRKYGGTGLGLNLSRQLVERMGGRLEVQSQAGVGSQFFFTVSLEKAK